MNPDNVQRVLKSYRTQVYRERIVLPAVLVVLSAHRSFKVIYFSGVIAGSDFVQLVQIHADTRAANWCRERQTEGETMKRVLHVYTMYRET